MLVLAVTFALAATRPPPVDCAATLPRPGRRFSGIVTRVIDGDSLCVSSGRGAVHVRLVDFDAPELGQPYGAQAKATLRRIVQGRRVNCRAGHVSYSRTVAICRLEGVPLGDLMRRAGMPEGGN